MVELRVWRKVLILIGIPSHWKQGDFFRNNSGKQLNLEQDTSSCLSDFCNMMELAIGQKSKEIKPWFACEFADWLVLTF